MIKDRIIQSKGDKRKYFISVFIGTGIFITFIESLFPRPLPFLRLGLGNIVIVAGLGVFSLKELILIQIFRLFLAGILRGTLLGLPFFLGLIGGIASILGMYVCYKFFYKFFSLIGICVLGALISNSSQLLASLYFFPVQVVRFLVPVVILIALITGSITGIISQYFYKKVLLYSG